MSSPHGERGVSLIETVVSTSLMLLVFVGVSAAFQLSVDAVTNNKARAGAIALANERQEFVRSLSYDSLGTSGGIPAGAIPQSETVSLNGITYTRRTLILYEDDPKDGLGVADTNSVTADFKSVKTEVSWEAHNGGVRSVSLATRVSPIGVEQAVPGGTLALTIIGAGSQPIVDARVTIVNASTTPATNMTLYSDSAGLVTVIGAPPSAGYEITVAKEGFSTALTYDATTENTNPTPGHLTVALNQTTAVTFAIDQVSTMNIRSFTAVETFTNADAFADSDGLSELVNAEVVGGGVQLVNSGGLFASSGEVRSIAFSTTTPIVSWGSFAWDDTKPAMTNIVYRVYTGDGTALVPDTQIPGNSAGFSSSPIDLTGVATSSYQSLSVRASLGTVDEAVTPEIRSWEISYDAGPLPLQNLTFSLRGTKTIGSGPGGTLYKYSTSTLTTGVSAGVNLAAMEWDTYTLTVDSSTGYDIASSCGTQPKSVAPGTYDETVLMLAPHTAHSLLVDLRSSGGTMVPGATVRLTRGAIDTTVTADNCGQAFFSGLSSGTPGAGNPYTIEVTAPEFAPYSTADVSVSGTSRLSIILN